MTAIFRFPLCDGWFFASPPYCAAREQVPTGRKLAVACATSFSIVPPVEKPQFDAVKITSPVTGLVEVTVAVRAKPAL